MVMPETGLKEGLVLAERIRKSLEAAVFDGPVDPVTLSGGVREYQGQSVTEMIQEADERLYRAKKLGRNRIVGD